MNLFIRGQIEINGIKNMDLGFEDTTILKFIKHYSENPEYPKIEFPSFLLIVLPHNN